MTKLIKSCAYTQDAYATVADDGVLPDGAVLVAQIRPDADKVRSECVSQIFYYIIQLFIVDKVRRQTHLLGHLPQRKRSPDPAEAGFIRCFPGLCVWSLSTGVGARRAGSHLSAPVVSGPDDCASLVFSF